MVLPPWFHTFYSLTSTLSELPVCEPRHFSTNDPSAPSSQPPSSILKSLSLQSSLTLGSPLSLLIQERQHSLVHLAAFLVYIQAVASWVLDGAQWVDFSLNMSLQASGKHCLGNQPNFPTLERIFVSLSPHSLMHRWRTCAHPPTHMHAHKPCDNTAYLFLREKCISPLSALNFPHVSSSLLSVQAKVLTYTSLSTRVVRAGLLQSSQVECTVLVIFCFHFCLFVCFAKVGEIQLSHQLLTPSLLSFAPFVSLRKCVIVLF